MRNPTMHATHQTHQHGFALLEILIVATLLAIALLGLASVQSSSLQFNESAYNRTQAAVIARDMAERMRANLIGATAGYYDDVEVGGKIFGNPPDCTLTACDPEDLADYDIWQWAKQINDLLPSGAGAIVKTNDPLEFDIHVMWDDRRDGASGTGCDKSDPNDMTCVALNVQF